MKTVGIIGGIGPESTVEYYRSIKERNGIDGLILGGTELPLILTEPEHNGIPLLDTTRIHVERIVTELLS